MSDCSICVPETKTPNHHFQDERGEAKSPCLHAPINRGELLYVQVFYAASLRRRSNDYWLGRALLFELGLDARQLMLLRSITWRPLEESTAHGTVYGR